jgi:DNA-directed RNA polymerase subunit RPC12/RpoP
MSEFKYACPVCGQHIKCDSTQSGTTMECPTCFQKIVAPQAPATDDPKFIITGTKLDERPIPGTDLGAAPAPVPEKNFPAPTIVLMALLCAAAALFVFSGKFFKSAGGLPPPPPGGPTVPAHPPKLPPLIAPSANDTNWMLDLAAAVIPEERAAGRIHGRDFICERAFLQSGTLTLRTGTHGTVELGVLINFKNAQTESLSGQSINVATNADKAANVMLRWLEDGRQKKENFDDRYAMRLEFGPLVGNHLPGKIYLCTPDDGKSYVAGAFIADIRKPKPPKSK